MIKKVNERAYWSLETIHQCYSTFPWYEKRAYAQYLAQIYYYVDHATRLLGLGAARCKLNEEKFHMHFIRNIHEEKNHEEMAKRDLKCLGFKIKDFPELPETSAYYQTLYYMIDNDGPVALLGYFIPLEGLASERLPVVYNYLVSLFGAEACSFLKEHCVLDKSHFAQGLKFLENCNDEQLQVVDKAIVLSTHLYCGIYNRIKSEFPAVREVPFRKSVNRTL